MGICDVFHRAQKKRKVRMLGEAGKLSAAILAHIDQLLDSRISKQRKEFFCRFAREADRAEKALHCAQKSSICSGEPRKAYSWAWRRSASSRAEFRSATKSEPLANAVRSFSARSRSS